MLNTHISFVLLCISFVLLCCYPTAAEETNQPPACQPPLAVVICEDQIRFIFFPFVSPDNLPCLDAIVCTPVDIFSSVSTITIDQTWFVFICYYLNEAFHNTELKLLKTDTYQITPHPKKSYNDKMEPVKNFEV